MVKGLNSDIVSGNRSYHVQTEDWGPKNPFLVSRIFLNGAVVKTFKSSRPEEKIDLALKRQHFEILDFLASSQSF